MGGGMMGVAHDSATMEQLRVIHTLFINHDHIKRTVTNLPNGIRTVTESDDPKIAALLKAHVADMMKRVGAGDDPGLPIESDALHSIFRDQFQCAMQVPARLIMHADPCRAGMGKCRNKFVRILDHQMAIQRQPGHFAERRHHMRTHREVGHKMSIHHIHMDHGSASTLGCLNLIGKMREIGGKN